MAHLQDFPREDLATLLGADKLPEVELAPKLEPNKVDRTILIGIGGAGVRTLDRLKGELTRRLDPSWKKYVAFLALDTSWSELEQVSYLDRGEQFCYTLEGADLRMSDPERYPDAVRPFMPLGARLSALDSDGAGQKRLVGKVKIHDARPGAAADKSIVDQLRTIRDELDQLASYGSGRYMVYLIGSVCGGTGGGGLLELPALIRQGLPAYQTQICAMLYLPDVMCRLDPMSFPSLSANGYATLKELNYYMGMSMRPGYPERWSYNYVGKPELELQDRFIDAVFFHSARPGESDPLNAATTAFAGHLTERLTADLVAAGFKVPGSIGGFFKPDVDPRRRPEQPEGYYDLDFAKAGPGTAWARSWALSRLCREAGLGGGQPMDAREGTRQARELLDPILCIFRELSHVDVSFQHEVAMQAEPIRWRDIREGRYDTAAQAKIDYLVRRHSDAAVLRDRIQEAFHYFRGNVERYVKEKGPQAFCDLYQGRFTSTGNCRGTGIEEMLRMLSEGRVFVPDRGDFVPFPVPSLPECAGMLRACRDTIQAQAPRLIDLGGVQAAQAGQWTQAMDAWIRARILDIRYRAALGEAGMLATEVLAPAARLAEQLRDFGWVLESLTDLYERQGRALERDRGRREDETFVDLLDFCPEALAWVRETTEQAVADGVPARFRDALVSDFFEDPESWLAVPEALYTRDVRGDLCLTDSDTPIPARRRFEELAACGMPPMELSIEGLFRLVQQGATSCEQFAQEIMRRLRYRVTLKHESEPEGVRRSMYLGLPATLHDDPANGAILAAIGNAAYGIGLCDSDIYFRSDPAGIVLECVYGPFEIGRVPGLVEWERAYEQGPRGISYPYSFLHGLSPDVVRIDRPGSYPVYEEQTPWVDYPPIAPAQGDPRLPDPRTGEISREGRLLRKLDALVAKARELGVLYCQQDASGAYQVYRAYCDRSVEWRIQPELLLPDENGFLPQGRALAEQAVAQNGKSFSEISAPVRLADAGPLSSPAETEEAAWEHATRVLRVHMPMQIEVRKTGKVFASWGEKIKAWNERQRQRRMTGMMLDMVRAGTLRRSPEGIWTLRTPEGGEQGVANCSDAAWAFLPPRDRSLLQNGLQFYFLFRQLSRSLGGKDTETLFANFRREHERALRAYWDLMDAGDTDTLERGRELAAEPWEEARALSDKGADLSSDEKPLTEDLRKALGEQTEAGFSDEELEEIQHFYARLALPTALGED